jgi:hypothetical protein
MLTENYYNNKKELHYKHFKPFIFRMFQMSATTPPPPQKVKTIHNVEKHECKQSQCGNIILEFPVFT